MKFNVLRIFEHINQQPQHIVTVCLHSIDELIISDLNYYYLHKDLIHYNPNSHKYHYMSQVTGSLDYPDSMRWQHFSAPQLMGCQCNRQDGLTRD